jgi:hypothetical protein
MKNKADLDYTPYYLEAKRQLAQVHELLNKHRYVDSLNTIDEIVVELRMMRAAIKSRIE